MYEERQRQKRNREFKQPSSEEKQNAFEGKLLSLIIQSELRKQIPQMPKLLARRERGFVVCWL